MKRKFVFLIAGVILLGIGVFIIAPPSDIAYSDLHLPDGDPMITVRYNETVCIQLYRAKNLLTNDVGMITCRPRTFYVELQTIINQHEKIESDKNKTGIGIGE